MMPPFAQPRERWEKLSPVGEGRQISLVDPRHLVDGESQHVGNGRDVVDFVERELPALARFQIFFEHLIPADVKIPDGRRDGLEALCLVDRDGLLLGRIAHCFNGVVALAVIHSEPSPRKFTQEMRLNERPAKKRKPFEVFGCVRKGNAREVHSKGLGVSIAITRRMENRVYVTKYFLGTVMMGVALIKKISKISTEIFFSYMSFVNLPQGENSILLLSRA